MTTLNKSLPHGTITGNPTAFPTARYSQKGAMFNAAGECLTADGVTHYDASKHSEDPVVTVATQTAEANAELNALSDEVTKLTQELTAAESALDAAKDGDINADGYTDSCTIAQKQLTKIKRALTKATNKAAVLESNLASAGS
jgi:chromosome segregation ATPase